MSQRILKTWISETSYASTCDRIQSLLQTRQSSYIIAANVHVVMTAYWQPKYRDILNQAALVTPDGMPLVWGMRWLGAKEQTRVYGPDLMLAWCDRAIQTHTSIYLYGSSPQTLQRLSTKLQQQYPNLQIAGTHAPPFRTLTPAEEALDRERIRRSGANVVFVGLGCPKQEEWMYRQLGKLDVVMIGVGAAFKFHSGEVSQAPRWMMRYGLEWLFRLAQEPQRLWSRYLLTNSAFVILFLGQLTKYFFNHHTRPPVLSNK
ncbi:MAG: N-acetylglucosaminyldiphosphoundecaprenol N-acetyl-beta-D-mannosaminyltransferase [Phormidesmis priestleyi Ana]|uniref:N-acetylglucosaminyldiphosphoundecaprenol N-acetyl-beta-D-mannosaminyltransferase n=1 Tax=Phormidesmis priestleyi Ana TaxID=1666911 RepID=A0A0P8DH89_9CYAN|nr:MAG: N-acetylglucosaminyldiphosphoundecaprenol N-acetyl-beta-D-mannosaminyltransferase [Phormidesmis priestleyi Ana]